jgi:hypothetical protein
MSASKKISALEFGYDFYTGRKTGGNKQLNINYCPLVQDERGFLGVGELSGNVRLQDWAQVPFELSQKLEALERLCASLLPSYEVDIDGTLRIEPIIAEIFCNYYTKPPVEIPSQLSVMRFFPIGPGSTTQENLKWESLSRSQQLLVSNVASWVKQQAWTDLANKLRSLSGQPVQAAKGHRVFLSYKRESISEPIAQSVAHRLSQQHIVVWFDEWEIKAGDSVVGKIGEGFKNSDACLIFLDSQYSSSDWCTKEMNTALTKAITENFTVIPVLVEDCAKPELLKDLKHVYLKEPSAPEFEQKLAEITDAIYKVDLNPYR